MAEWDMLNTTLLAVTLGLPVAAIADDTRTKFEGFGISIDYNINQADGIFSRFEMSPQHYERTNWSDPSDRIYISSYGISVGRCF